MAAAKTEAQEEFDSIIAKASAGEKHTSHPSDREDYTHDRDNSDVDEEESFQARRVDEEMKVSFAHESNGSGLRLPHKDFDNGRTTGVKGVIADARSFEEAKRSGSWRNRIGAAARESSVGKRASSLGLLRERDGSGSEEVSGSDEEEFMERWRQSRRDELVREGNDIRNRRTSPSVRRYGRFDEVDAMGYLDAIEKVGRDTVVVVFVYDSESAVSQVIQDALTPLVPQNPHIHFVRVHYEDIEFDAAGVPAVLAYKNQGDLFANLTYIIGLIPDDTIFDTPALESIFKKHAIL